MKRLFVLSCIAVSMLSACSGGGASSTPASVPAVNVPTAAPFVGPFTGTFRGTATSDGTHAATALSMSLSQAGNTLAGSVFSSLGDDGASERLTGTITNGNTAYLATGKAPNGCEVTYYGVLNGQALAGTYTVGLCAANVGTDNTGTFSIAKVN